MAWVVDPQKVAVRKALIASITSIINKIEQELRRIKSAANTLEQIVSGSVIGADATLIGGASNATRTLGKALAEAEKALAAAKSLSVMTWVDDNYDMH